MSLWDSHAMCAECWDARHPGRFAGHIIGLDLSKDPCCYCGRLQASGIFFRDKKPPFCQCKESENA